MMKMVILGIGLYVIMLMELNFLRAEVLNASSSILVSLFAVLFLGLILSSDPHKSFQLVYQ